MNIEQIAVRRNLFPIGGLYSNSLIQLLISIIVISIYFVCGAVHAQSHERDVVEISVVQKLSLRGHLSIFHDAHHLDAQTLVREHAADFRRLPSTISEGFTGDAVWIAFTVQSSGLQYPETYWLEFDQPLFRDIHLYEWSDHKAVEVWTRGLRGGRAEDFDFRKPAFRIELADNQPHRFLVRVQTPTAIASDVIVWAPSAFANTLSVEQFAWGMIFGSYLLAILFYLGFSIYTREKMYGLYTVYVSLCFTTAFFTGAWPLEISEDLSLDAFYKTLAVAIFLCFPVVTRFSIQYLQTGKLWPRLSRYFEALQWLIAALASAALWPGLQHRVMPVVQSYGLVVIVGLVVMAVYLARQGQPRAKLFLLAFLPYYIGVIWRFLKNMGMAEHSFWSDNSYQLGTFIHVMVLSFGLFAMYSNIRKDKERVEMKLQAESALRKEHAEFMAMISHEFRTPLSIIAATSDNLLNAPDLEDKSRSRVEKILRANQRLHELMDKHLSSERLLFDALTTELSPCDLRRCAQRVVADFQDMDGARVQLQPGVAVWVDGNDELIRLALSNLLSNAKRYTPAPGEIEVSLEREGEWACLRVRDSGPGITQQDMPKIFDKYFRGSSTGQPGAGLGLYLVQWIMRRHQGHVEAVNHPEGGSVFTLCFRTHSKSVQEDRT